MGKLVAPECNSAQREEAVANTLLLTFSFSSAFKEWLIAVAEACGAHWVTADSVRAVMSIPRRPPVMWDQAATALMLLLSGGVIGLPNTAHEIFYAQEIGGAQWAGLDVADYVELGFTWGQGYSAKGAYKGYLEQFSEPGVYDPHAMFPLSTGPTIVYPQVILERLIDVHAPDYFQGTPPHQPCPFPPLPD